MAGNDGYITKAVAATNTRPSSGYRRYERSVLTANPTPLRLVERFLPQKTWRHTLALPRYADQLSVRSTCASRRLWWRSYLALAFKTWCPATSRARFCRTLVESWVWGLARPVSAAGRLTSGRSPQPDTAAPQRSRRLKSAGGPRIALSRLSHPARMSNDRWSRPGQMCSQPRAI